MSKTKRVIKVSITILAVLILTFCAGTFLGHLNSNRINGAKKSEDLLKQDPNQLYVGEEMKKREYDENLKRFQRFSKELRAETKIVLLEEKGSIVISHDKTADNNKYTEWLFDSTISIRVDYTATISIPTSAITTESEQGKTPKVVYQGDKISVSSIEIDSIISGCNTSILGERYSPPEVSALTLVAKDRIREQLELDRGTMFLAKQGLINYLNTMALKLNIFDIQIIEK